MTIVVVKKRSRSDNRTRRDRVDYRSRHRVDDRSKQRIDCSLKIIKLQLIDCLLRSSTLCLLRSSTLSLRILLSDLDRFLTTTMVILINCLNK